MKNKPVIGITLDLLENSNKNYYSTFPWYALRKNYSDCVILAQGLPLMIPYQIENIDEILENIDGLIIPGGDFDIHPKLYNQEILSDKILPNLKRTNFEIAITKQVLKRKMPFLGICNGMQLLNICYDGSLIQDINAYYQTNINHEQPHLKSLPSHDINIEINTKLYSLGNNKSNFKVNSTHHQAIDKLGKNLIASARAPDNLIEAIEDPKENFVLGIQWHPEYNNNILDRNIFEELVLCAKKYRCAK
ncbi:MAG: gamma-glutamyl-gamma-aminobutyrate hydrolase family protein [Rickettsiaceae bacterium]